jgi:hypothetical protein
MLNLKNDRRRDRLQRIWLQMAFNKKYHIHILRVKFQSVLAAIPRWSLQQNTNLANPSSWTASSGANPVNGTNYLNITGTTGSLFIRVRVQ